MNNIKLGSGFQSDLLIGLLAGAILFTDLSIPLGVAAGVPYVLVMVLASMSRSSTRVLFWAGFCSFLTIVGYYSSPLGSDLWKVLTNRMLALLAIWSIVGLYFYFAANKERLKQLEEEIGRENKLSHLGLVAKYARDAVIITDKDGLITWVNSSFVDISGYTLEEVQGEKPSKFLQGNETSLSEIQKISEHLKRGEQVDSELLNYHKDGSKYWIDISISPVFKDGKVDKFIAVERDITYKKGLEQNIREQGCAAQAESARQSHILNVFKRQVRDVHKLAESNGVLYSNGNAIGFLESMERFNNLVLHPDEFNHTPIEVGNRLKVLVKELDYLTKAKGYKLNYTFEGDLTGFKICESTIQHERFLMFLVIALEPTKQQKELQINFCFIPKGQALHFDIDLTVPDDGFLARDIDNLRVKRVNNSRLESMPEVFDTIISRPDKGFGYTILNSDGNSQFSLVADMPIREACSREECGHRVLIAEDNRVNVMVLSKLVHKLGYNKVDIAENGAKAVEMASSGMYSVILMDNHMPEMTGIEATRVILEEKSIPVNIIACTADAAPEVRDSFVNYGAKEVLLKPIKKEQLQAALENLSTSEQKVG